MTPVSATNEFGECEEDMNRKPETTTKVYCERCHLNAVSPRSVLPTGWQVFVTDDAQVPVCQRPQCARDSGTIDRLDQTTAHIDRHARPGRAALT